MKYLGKSWEQAGRWFRLTGRTGLKIFGIDANIYNPYGVDLDSNQFIIIGNHRSWFDQVAVTASMPRPFHILAHEKYFRMPTLGYALRTWQGVPVRDQRLSLSENKQILDYIKRKENMFFFIEGTRGTGKELLPFRSGAFKLAAKTGVAILPLYIFGGEDCLHKTKSLLAVKPGKIDIVIGEPVMFNLQDLNPQISSFREKYETLHDKMYDAFYIARAKEKLSENRNYENTYYNFIYNFNSDASRGL